MNGQVLPPPPPPITVRSFPLLGVLCVCRLHSSKFITTPFLACVSPSSMLISSLHNSALLLCPLCHLQNRLLLLLLLPRLLRLPRLLLLLRRFLAQPSEVRVFLRC